jgi:hypothetical protein
MAVGALQVFMLQLLDRPNVFQPAQAPFDVLHGARIAVLEWFVCNILGIDNMV